MVKIENEFLVVEIQEKGAEVIRVISKEDGKNYMWDKNPEIWNGVSPNLFPTVGKSIGDEIRYDGKIYKLGNHGFARHSIFQWEKSLDGKSADFILDDSMIEKNSFPFQFYLDINYRLEDRKLITTYYVKNPGDGKTIFTLGAHPAFKVPFHQGKKIGDYYVEFPMDTQLILHELTSFATYTGRREEFNLEDGKLDLRIYDVANTYVFSDFKSEYVKLIEKGSGNFIKVDIKGFKYLAFWKKSEGDFICIEPWIGKSDMEGFRGEFHEKEDMITLNKNEDFRIGYGIEFMY
ncbi:MAG: aldose 1-epimerase family protein [Fusobacteriaceae bacterium]